MSYNYFSPSQASGATFGATPPFTIQRYAKNVVSANIYTPAKTTKKTETGVPATRLLASVSVPPNSPSEGGGQQSSPAALSRNIGAAVVITD